MNSREIINVVDLRFQWNALLIERSKTLDTYFWNSKKNRVTRENLDRLMDDIDNEIQEIINEKDS